MTLNISELEGVNEALAAKLKELGLNDSEKLLSAVATPQLRKELVWMAICATPPLCCVQQTL